MKTKHFLLAVIILMCSGWLISSCERTSDEYIDSYKEEILPPEDITSNFTTGNDGWKISGDAQQVDAEFDSQGGFIWADDNTTGGVWYYEAPSKYLGNKEDAYGGKIKFSLKVDQIDAQFEAEDLILESSNMTIAFNTSYNPGVNWTDYEVVISASAGWTVGDNNGPTATESQIRSVLSNLTRFRIRGEFRTGYDTGALDNVEFPGV